MLIIEAFKTCPYGNKCPHVSGIESCMGTNPNRSTIFTCDFVDEQGNISEAGFRNPNDQTGTQQILHD